MYLSKRSGKFCCISFCLHYNQKCKHIRHKNKCLKIYGEHTLLLELNEIEINLMLRHMYDWPKGNQKPKPSKYDIRVCDIYEND